MALELAPEDQDKLAQLFGAKDVTMPPGVPPNAAFQPTPGISPQVAGQPTGVDPMIVDRWGGGGASQPNPMPAAAAQPAAAAGPVAQASDDPRLQVPATSSGAPAMPKVPTFQNVDPTKMQGISDALSKVQQPINRQDYQPHWWERMLAPVAAGLTTVAGGDGMQAAGNMLSRRYNVAMENQRKQASPLQAEFERQQKILPMQKEANQIEQDKFSDSDRLYQNYQKDREFGDALEQRRDAANERNDTRQQEQDRKSDEDKNTPAPGARPELYMDNGKPAMRVRTKSGDYMPWNAKSIDEGAMAGDPRATALYNRAHPGREDKGEKPASKAQSRIIESKKQQGLDDAEDDYSKTISDLDEQKKAASNRKGSAVPYDDSRDRQAALDKLNKTKQRVQNAYEAEIAAAGGDPGHFDYGRGGTKGATSQPETAAQPAASTGSKATTKDVVQKYADSHKMTYAQALSGFQKNGYDVK